jgi:CRP-like cAMP-binding protein
MAELTHSPDGFGAVTPQERAALEALELDVLHLRRRAEIQAEHDPANALYVLKEGCVKASVGLDGGGRQIIGLHFPGDLLGARGLGHAKSVCALHAASDVTVAMIDRTALAALFAAHPRLGFLLYISAQHDAVGLMQRLCSLGQTSARARVAALLVSTCERLRLPVENGGAVRVPFPFTQLELGQMAGLSAVHINRVVKSFVGEGLLSWRRDVVTVWDMPRLREIAALPRHDRTGAFLWPSARPDFAHLAASTAGAFEQTLA